MSAIPQKIGRYDILELVGKGGMGVLYRAHDASLERDVAVKMMHIDFTLDAAARERFQREARAVARLQHRNIVTIHELGEIDGMPFIVMEFLGGEDLDTALKSGRALSLAQKLDIVAQLCEALAYAHDQGIVHRDIKPGNVRLLEDGTVKILDFGIARFAASSLTVSGTVMGTPSYMAPEQIMGQPVDGRADLFSAGVLLYEMLSGTRPFSGDSPTAVAYQIMHAQPADLHEKIPDLPDAVNVIVARALQKNPDERYAKAREMASDLHTIKMMLDLPLHQGGGDTGVVTSENAVTQLFAATIGRPATGSSAAGSLPIHPSAASAEAAAAPTARAQKLPRVPVMLMAAVVVVLAVLGGVWMLRGSDAVPAEPAPSESTAGGPTAEPQPPPVRTLRVVSNPAGAHILLDGVDTGQVTPAEVSVGTDLPGSVELSLDGHETVKGEITKADLDAGEKEFRLRPEPRPTRVTISGPYPFELVRGSQVLSETSTEHELTVQPGGQVVARNPAYLLNYPLDINFRSGRTASFEVPGLGTLVVFTVPRLETCTVIAGGQDLGYPPITGKQVAAGQHTVQLKCEDGSSPTERTRVTAGQRAEVTFRAPED